MARTKSDNIQINISISTGWKTKLENPARIYSVEEGESIIFPVLKGNVEEILKQILQKNLLPH